MCVYIYVYVSSVGGCFAFECVAGKWFKGAGFGGRALARSCKAFSFKEKSSNKVVSCSDLKSEVLFNGMSKFYFTHFCYCFYGDFVLYFCFYFL